MALSVPKRDPFSNLPYELKVLILQHLSVEDLCHVALCNRSWREATNDDALWRPLCREKRWEKFDAVVDLCVEPPFIPSSPQPGGDGSVGDSVTFASDSVVTGSNWPGLVNTCRWKEIYMKARHLEGNWKNNRYHVVSFEFGSGGYKDHIYGSSEPELIVCSLAGEGNSLAGALSNDTLHIWDISNGTRRHFIKVGISKGKKALQMKNGIIAAGCIDGKIRTYSAQTGEQLQVMSGHRLDVFRLFFDGDTIVSIAGKSDRDMEVCGDSDMRVWNAIDGTSIDGFVFESTSDDVRLVYVDYLDKTVAGAYSDRKIRLWDAQSGVCKQTIFSDANNMISCHLGDGIVISANSGNAIKIWNVESGECIRHFDVPGVDFEYWDSHDESTHFEFNGEFLLATSDYSNIRLFNLDGRFIGDTKSHEERMLEIRCILGNKVIASEECSYGAGSMYLWSIDHPEHGFELIKPLRGLMNDDEDEPLQPFEGTPPPLQTPITEEEVKTAITGPDGINSELFKHSKNLVSRPLAKTINSSCEHHVIIETLGEGTLITLPKPKKPPGPPANLRPIALLNSIRKILSIITLRRIRDKIDCFTGPYQSGFKRGRSCADIVWHNVR
ncbi:probable E3 ubiquitin ligase complex SCF subunit sconB [Patiria miniata]|uniref:F-box domain-containing protein n=1 Tax=Patiria miniata TaxID=46514 RepID=A0A914BHI7_PATMI|nr:probable E3 ubiquitin ligase complex SCF subunit sconB [Patiria miniata]